MDQAELDNRFAYHAPPTEQRKNAHQHVRDACRVMSEHLNDLVPEGREKSLAMTHLEEVMFWANAALARKGD